MLDIQYPYKILAYNSNKCTLERCTHAYNCHTPYIIDVNWGIGIADSTNGMLRTDLNPINIQKELNVGWKEFELNVRQNHKKK